MVCSITILFLECCRLYSFSSCDSFILLFFLFGSDDIWSGKSFSTPRYPRSNTFTTCLGVTGWFLYKYHSHVSSSFLMMCFMDDNAMIVNNKLILYSVPFFLT